MDIWSIYQSSVLLIFGLILGSFLNVLIYRIPRRESIVLPPSHCPHCQHRLGVVDLIPVLSYLWLKGHCHYCKTAINPRYPLVEIVTGLLTWVWWLRIGLTINGIAILVLIYVLVVIAAIDWEHQVIPNVLTLPMIVLGLTFQTLQGDFIKAVLGGLVGGGILYLLLLCYPKGMGFGDVKLLGMIGIFLGVFKTVLILFLGSWLGVLVIGPLMLAKRMDRKTPFAFGPFLVLAALIVLYGWPELVRVLPKEYLMVTPHWLL